MSKRVRTCLIGTGRMAVHHIREMLKQTDSTEIVAICEPSLASYDRASRVFTAAGLEPPPNLPDLDQLLDGFAGKLDAAFIMTPHAYHHDQTRKCMEAGLDVLLEKPMVMNAAEAESLIEARRRTGKLLVVAFQGGLSPQVRAAVKMLRAGELGELLNVNGVVWQNWNAGTANTWRQQPEVAGGGFVFDTGAHMLNTVCDLVGEDFAEVSAWLDNRGRPVDIRGVVMGRLASGVMVTINACGDAIPGCESEILVFCTQAIVRTGQWGERLDIRRAGRKRFSKIDLPPMRGAWEQFILVRNGEIPNPCPPEVGLRMARLWDAIRASAAQQGTPVRLNSTREYA